MTLRSLACLLLACAGPLGAASTDPAPADVTNEKGKTFKGYVLDEQLGSGLTFCLGDPKDPAAARLTFAPGTYQVNYNDTQDVHLLTARMCVRTGKLEQALAQYTDASAEARYAWERQEALLGAATVAEQTNHLAQGIQALQSLRQAFPQSINLPQAIYLLGHEQALAGQKAAAEAAFTELRAHAQDWGVAASVRGIIGSAELAVSEGKVADAITALKPWLTSADLDPARHPAEFAQLGLYLASLQVKAKDAGAADTFRAVAYAPVGAVAQSQAQLGWARLLADLGDAGSLLGAFDHAAIAAVLPKGDDTVRREAIGLATALVPRIRATGADPAAQQKLSSEYNGYVSKL